MRLQFYSVSVALLLAVVNFSQAMAQPSSIQTDHPSMGIAIGNRTEVVYANGDTVRIWLKPGGRFDMTAPDGSTARGDWLADDRHICMIITEPPPVGHPPSVRCEPVFGSTRTFDQPWSVKDSHNDPVTITVHRD